MNILILLDGSIENALKFSKEKYTKKLSGKVLQVTASVSLYHGLEINAEYKEIKRLMFLPIEDSVTSLDQDCELNISSFRFTVVTC